MPEPPKYLADHLTLFQPWGADSAHPLLKCGCLMKSFIINDFLTNPHFSGTPNVFHIPASLDYRGVIPGGVGGTIAPTDFGRSLNPISTRGDRLCLPNNTGTPGFSDLPTALDYIMRQS